MTIKPNTFQVPTLYINLGVELTSNEFKTLIQLAFAMADGGQNIRGILTQAALSGLSGLDPWQTEEGLTGLLKRVLDCRITRYLKIRTGVSSLMNRKLPGADHEP